MTTEPPCAPVGPITQTRRFWVLVGFAAALGVFGAAAGLVFMGVIGFGDNWYVDPTPGWFGGRWWWVAVTAGAGVLVGVLRRVTRLPEQTSGLDRRPPGRTCRPRPGARDRCRVGGVLDRRSQRRARRRPWVPSAAAPAPCSPAAEGSTPTTRRPPP